MKKIKKLILILLKERKNKEKEFNTLHFKNKIAFLTRAETDTSKKL